MLIKTIKYTDLDGETVTDKLYFNMSTVDMTRFLATYADYTDVSMEDKNGTKKAMEAYINKIIRSKNVKEMIDFLENFILSAYGEKTQDARGFVKSKAIREKFSYTIAYAELFEELFTDENKFEKFIRGVVENSNEEPNKSNIKHN